MNKLAVITVLMILLSACGETSPKSAEGTQEEGNSAAMSSLDSIDQTNAESVLAAGDAVTKAYVSSSDSSIFLAANMRQDHRIFAYAQADVNAKRLLLLSIFTNDVENNPFGCELGAYYDTAGMGDLSLKFVSVEGEFVKALAMDKTGKATTLYFEKQWIDFE